MIAGAGHPAATGPVAGPGLRDIHLPADPAWWPPAPGWWLLAGLALVALVVVAWAWRRHRRMHGRRQQILDELEHLLRQHRANGGRTALLQAMHQLLRRVARQHDAHATRQRGETWRTTLARVPVDAATLDRLLALDELIYQPEGEYDTTASVAAVGSWLRLAVKPSNWKPAAPVRESADA